MRGLLRPVEGGTGPQGRDLSPVRHTLPGVLLLIIDLKLLSRIRSLPARGIDYFDYGPARPPGCPVGKGSRLYQAPQICPP